MDEYKGWEVVKMLSEHKIKPNSKIIMFYEWVGDIETQECEYEYELTVNEDYILFDEDGEEVCISELVDKTIKFKIGQELIQN